MAPKHVTFVNVAEAKARFAELVRLAGTGAEIVIVRDHKPVARLTSARVPGARQPGTARGRLTMAPDFDAPLPDFEA